MGTEGKIGYLNALRNVLVFRIDFTSIKLIFLYSFHCFIISSYFHCDLPTLYSFHKYLFVVAETRDVRRAGEEVQAGVN
jgi:hypothetical protein